MPVVQPLAFDAANGRDHALPVRHAPVVPTERELIAVAVQVFLAQLVEDSVVTAFQEGEEALPGVRVDHNADHGVLALASVFPRAVLDYLMGLEVLARARTP